MSRIVKAAAVQIAPDLTSREKTLARVLDAIDEAAGNGAELVVFPETFVPYYPYFSFVLPPVQQGKPHLALYEQAVTVPSDETRRVAERCAHHGVVAVLGINERDHGSLYNAQLVFEFYKIFEPCGVALGGREVVLVEGVSQLCQTVSLFAGCHGGNVFHLVGGFSLR